MHFSKPDDLHLYLWPLHQVIPVIEIWIEQVQSTSFLYLSGANDSGCFKQLAVTSSVGQFEFAVSEWTMEVKNKAMTMMNNWSFFIRLSIYLALLHVFGPCAYFLLREFSAASPAWCYGLHGRPEATGKALEQTRQIWGICIKQDETMSRRNAHPGALTIVVLHGLELFRNRKLCFHLRIFTSLFLFGWSTPDFVLRCQDQSLSPKPSG